MVLTIIIAILSVIFLMVIHEFGHFIIAKKCGIKVEEFGIGYPPRLFGKKFGKTLYSINLIPLGAFVKIHGEEGGIEDYQSFVGLAMRKRVAIVLGGVISFWIVAIILFAVVFSIGVEIPIGDEDVLNPDSVKIEITKVFSDAPAGIVGLQEKDIIKEMKVGDNEFQKTNKIKDFQDFISLNKGKEIILKIQRGNDILEKSLTPRVSPPQNEGSLGIQLERISALIQKYPWYKAPVRGTIFCGELTYKAVESLVGLLASLFTGKGLPQGAEMAGPVGLTVFLARAVDMGVGFFLYFIAAVSTLLAVFNLLPIPALDGGKILFLAIEKIKGKPVSAIIEQRITIVFFFLLISLSLFITIKFDIPRFSEFWKNGF